MNCIIRFFANQPHRTPEGVALWTRAGGDWANTALALKQLAPYRERFAFIWDAERVAKVRPTVFDDHQAGLSVPVRRTKPLRKIWRRRDFQVPWVSLPPPSTSRRTSPRRALAVPHTLPPHEPPHRRHAAGSGLGSPQYDHRG
mmetsp:Transcript_45377/g.125026  ORF Transcript_45377/g.125026 Transcript_45377/m.125026 type:complete len:143 (+) Transcript_45377:779-1207(+)